MFKVSVSILCLCWNAHVAESSYSRNYLLKAAVNILNHLINNEQSGISGKPTPCDDSWTAFSGSCYLVSHDNLNFINAMGFCEQHNAHLVHINDGRETTFLKSYLGDLKDGYYWTGLTDEVTEGIWKWSDTDTVATYLNWRHGEPNGGKSANCVAVLADNSYNWTDDPCSYKNKAICEKRPAV